MQLPLNHLTNEQLEFRLRCLKKLGDEGWSSRSETMLTEMEQEAGLAPVAQPTEEPSAFRRRLLIDTAFGRRSLEECLDDWQREDYEAADQGWLRMVTGRGDARLNYYFERPKGHDKTTGLATMALWALYASPRPLVGVAGAGKLDQAALLRSAIELMVFQNPWLGESIKVNNYEVVNRRTGSRPPRSG